MCYHRFYSLQRDAAQLKGFRPGPLEKNTTLYPSPVAVYCVLCTLYLSHRAPFTLAAPVQIDAQIKLSGMPDLTMNFMNPSLFDDVSFHPCIRLKRWEVGCWLRLFLCISLDCLFLEHIAFYPLPLLAAFF